MVPTNLSLGDSMRRETWGTRKYLRKYTKDEVPNNLIPPGV